MHWLPNLDALDPAFQHPPWDPELQWSVPYMHGTTGSCIRRGIAPAPQAWADLWDARLRGKITMLDDPPEVLGGVSQEARVFAEQRAIRSELRAAQRQAMAQKPLLRAYLNAEVRDQLVAGDVAAAQAWAVTAGQAIAAAPDKLAFAFRRKGFARYADTMAILRESRRSRAGASVYQLPAAPGGGRGDRRGDADRDRERGGPEAAAGGIARESGAVSAARRFWRAASGSSRTSAARKDCGIDCGRRSRVPEDTGTPLWSRRRLLKIAARRRPCHRSGLVGRYQACLRLPMPQIFASGNSEADDHGRDRHSGGGVSDLSVHPDRARPPRRAHSDRLWILASVYLIALWAHLELLRSVLAAWRPIRPSR